MKDHLNAEAVRCEMAVCWFCKYSIIFSYHIRFELIRQKNFILGIETPGRQGMKTQEYRIFSEFSKCSQPEEIGF